MSDKRTVRRAGMPYAKGYSDAGASRARRALKGFLANSGAPSEDIDENNMTLRQRARMLYMASPVATSAINTNRTKVVGTGLTLKSTIKSDVLGLSPEAAKDWERQAEAEFALWAEKKNNCDATGVNNFEALQQLALKSWLMSGDVFAVFKRYDPSPLNPYTLRIHLVEADRVATPMGSGAEKTPYTPNITQAKATNGNVIYDGVEVDADGRIVAYHIRNTYPYELTVDMTKWARVLTYGELTGLPNILHIMDSERPDQYRGVTYLAQVIEPLLQLRRYTESELMGALIQSFFTAWIKTETDTSGIPINETGGGDVVGGLGEQPDNVSDSDNEYEMGPGTVLHLKEGEEVTFGNPNMPTAGFDSFVKTICRLIGAGLEMPYDVLVKEYNKSYSAARAALMEAWEAFKMRRKWFVDDFCQPVYEVWLSEAVALGRIKAPGFFTNPRIRAAWCAARWIGPVQGQIDPLKEVKADILAVDHAFKTHGQVAREYGGGDWQSNVEQLALENAQLINAGGSTAADLTKYEDTDPESKKEGDEDA